MQGTPAVWDLLDLEEFYHFHAPNQTCWFLPDPVNSPVEFLWGGIRTGKVASRKRKKSFISLYLSFFYENVVLQAHFEDLKRCFSEKLITSGSNKHPKIDQYFPFPTKIWSLPKSGNCQGSHFGMLVLKASLWDLLGRK